MHITANRSDIDSCEHGQLGSGQMYKLGQAFGEGVLADPSEASFNFQNVMFIRFLFSESQYR